MIAEAGPDQTIQWGLEDFNLDGCGPDGSNLGGVSLCEIEYSLGDEVFDSLFDITWLVDGDELIGTDDELQLSNLILLYPDLFTGPGTYIIDLIIQYSGGPFTHEGVIFSNGQTLVATDYMTLYIISAPASLSLAALGGLWILRTRRKSLNRHNSSSRSEGERG